MNKFIGYIGNFASGAESGIHVIEADRETGTPVLLQKVGDCEAPNYIAISKNRRFAYVARRSATAGPDQNGEVAAYAIQPDGTLLFLNAAAGGGNDGLCHLSCSPDGRYVYAANYDEGKIILLCTAEDGLLSGPLQVIQCTGSGPHPRQDSAHIHFTGPSADGKYVCCVDLTRDVVEMYAHADDGLLQLEATVPTPRGEGARHLTFSPDGKYYYVTTELGSTVAIYSYHEGQFQYENCVSSLPEDYTGEKAASAIRISPDGKLLLVGNRFADNIAVFRVNPENGDIILKSNVPCPWPRDLNFTPDGRFVYVCGQLDDIVQVYSVDYYNATLSLTNNRYAMEAPSCVEFL